MSATFVDGKTSAALTATGSAFTLRGGIYLFTAHINSGSGLTAGLQALSADGSSYVAVSPTYAHVDGYETLYLCPGEYRFRREQEPKSPFVFTSERGAPFSTAGFARMVERAGEAARLGFKAHPHMLRHACGFALASKGHDTRALQAYLGHKNIQHTVRYTELAPTRFKNFWRD